jgi:hypothetical protein
VTVPPVIYIFFNRPEVTRRTFSVIRAQRPRRLYLIADGPRAHKAGEDVRCRETRALVESMIDWDCEVTRDYSETNLGCGRRLSSGLTAAFAMLGEAIVLEDDILPHPDFFGFCATLLARHRNDPHVHAVSGFNALGRYAPRQGWFTPSLFNSVWGWASWQRSWQDYDFSMDAWKDPNVKVRIRKYVASDFLYQYFSRSFDHMVDGAIDTWDFQWTFSLLERGRVTLVPSSNLIENIGFSTDATHTTKPEPYFQGLKTYPLMQTDRERSTEVPDRMHDDLYGRVVMSPSTAKIRLVRHVANSRLLLAILRHRKASS